MKHVRITVRPDGEESPPFLRYLLDGGDVTEARAVDWNRGSGEASTHLYAFDGTPSEFETATTDTAGVESVALSNPGDGWSYALLELRDSRLPVFGGAAAAIDRAGLVVQRPLVYRDGHIRGYVVGESAVLQATLEDAPDALDVRVDEISEFPSGRRNPANALSGRQREAVEAALALGYYDVPRQATHADVAAELDCARNTASEHLQKAQATLVRAGLGAFGPQG